ncbi:MAG: hypothetical protein HWN68_16235 [Desulfobacterales bacterium]|nr:hypothetical protein [Desulfobacterales bacterium]
MVESHPEAFSRMDLEDVEIATVAKIIFHGRRFHLTLRKVDVDFWGLKSGDRVLVKITKVRRAKKGER